jgi:hypothetical protein
MAPPRLSRTLIRYTEVDPIIFLPVLPSLLKKEKLSQHPLFQK